MAKTNDSGGAGDRLVSDISELEPTQYWDEPWQSKGELVHPYGTQPLGAEPSPGNMSDGDRTDLAFERLGDKLEPGQEPAATYPGNPSSPQPKSDGEAADLAFRHLGK